MDEEQSGEDVNSVSEAVPELRALAWDLRDVIRRLEELAGRLDELASQLPAPNRE